MAEKIFNKTFQEERALYGKKDLYIENVNFEVPMDGESALKETTNVTAKNCRFLLRYPLWHVKGFALSEILMTDTCRAALWYSENGLIEKSNLGGIKALRECKNVKIQDSVVNSQEFGWHCSEISVEKSVIASEYAFMSSSNVKLSAVKFSGKYSFQYTENLTIENSVLETKDAFWHGKNVTVKNCVVKGEYLGWYSEGLTLINCKIIGTQPLCYCKNLRLENCTMEGCDLAFEYSDVVANVTSKIDSVKNPLSGKISAPEIGEIILEGSLYESTCEIEVGK